MIVSCRLGPLRRIPLSPFLLYRSARAGHERALARVCTVTSPWSDEGALVVHSNAARQALSKLVHAVLLLEVFAAPDARACPDASDRDNHDNNEDNPLPVCGNPGMDGSVNALTNRLV